MSTTTDVFTTIGAPSYNWSSMRPDQRADMDRREYREALDHLETTLSRLAETDHQRDIMHALMYEYSARYLDHYRTISAARGRTASWTVTGRSGFNVRRNEKAMSTYDKRVSEFHQWRQRFEATAQQHIIDARTDNQRDEALTQKIKNECARYIIWAAEADNGKFYPMTRSGYAKGITETLAKYWKQGHQQNVRDALAFVLEQEQKLPNGPLLTKRHRVWHYLDQ